MNPFLESVKAVWDEHRRDYVSVNFDKIKEWAEIFADGEFKLPDWRFDPYPLMDDPETTINFFGLVTGINAFYLDPVTKRKYDTVFRDKPYTGANAMTAAMHRAIFDDGYPLLSASYLRDELDLNTMKKIFAVNNINPMPWTGLRCEIFREIGTVLSEKYDGSFVNLFEAADYQCLEIVSRLTNDFPLAYNDFRLFDGQITYFHKKANLVCFLYEGRARSSNGVLKPLKGLEDMMPVADYQVPKILESMGILEYDLHLKNMIENREIIGQNSREEAEIRIGNVKGVELLLQEINIIRRERNQPEITHPQLDYPLWKQGSGSKAEHHITPTMDY